ncbi:major facilitator superfamily, putative [Plasmodium sp. gorilla clade G3]|nr:major facilitator superfamily, putative [Plasmodium sp. gorilla clade G3]
MTIFRDDENNFTYNKEYAKVKKRTLFKILLSVFIKTLFESFLQPLLPYFILNYYDIEVKELGILLSFYSFSQCVMCLIIGFFSSVNKKHLLVFLLMFNLFGIYLFYLKLNFTLLIINRIICGCSSVFTVVINTIINDLVDNNVCIYYTYINIFNAIGIILGPLLSSFLLTIFNFQIILNFNTFGLLVSLCIILTISSDLLVQNKIKNQPTESSLHSNLPQTDLEKKNITDNNNFNSNLHNINNSNNINNNNIIIIKNVDDIKHDEESERNTKAFNEENKMEDNHSILQIKSTKHLRMNDFIISSYNEEENNTNNYIVNNNEKNSSDGIFNNDKIFKYYSEGFSEITSYQQYLKTKDNYYISRFIYFLKQKLNLLIEAMFTYKFKCLLSICFFRFASAFALNLMSNIFFVFYNDNVSSDNKQIQVSIFVSLSGIIMIIYQYFSFSYTVNNFGYNGTAIIGLLIQSTGILLTYYTIKYYSLFFQYISICFIHSCSYAYIDPIIPTIISLFFDKKDQLFSQSFVSFFRYLSLTISPVVYSYYYIQNQFYPFSISASMSILSIFFVILSFKFHKKMKRSMTN